MNILLIDTCGETGSVAVGNLEGVRRPLMATIPGRTSSEGLLPTIRQLADPLSALGAIVVVHGPGSFTGIRVGLSAAKGLCEALGVPLIAISRLAVMAHAAELPTRLRVHAVLDAGRGEFYLGMYEGGRCLREALVGHDELVAGIAKIRENSVVVVCESAVADSLSALTPRLILQPTAETALPLAILRLQASQFDEIGALDANYLRRTDAEIFAKARPKASAAVPAA